MSRLFKDALPGLILALVFILIILLFPPTQIKTVPITVYAEPTTTQGMPEINEWIKICAALNDLDPALIHAIIKVESHWDPYAVSSSGAQGLMQIMPNDWSYYFYLIDSPIRIYQLPDNPNNVYSNILAGTNALAVWRTVCQDRGYLEVADYLSCYNAGYNYFKTKNRNYANTIIKTYEEDIWD